MPCRVDQGSKPKMKDSVIAETPLRLPKTGNVTAKGVFIITKLDNDFYGVHFD
jgi:hypothetical protein